MKEFLSQRIQTMPASATLAMHKQTLLLKQQGYKICDLSIGEPNFATPTYICQEAKLAIDNGNYFSYSPVAGYLDLRAAIAKKLQQENHIICETDQIVVSTGAKQSLSNLFLCLLDPGDEVIVYTPYWVSYVCLIQLAGGKPILVKGSNEKNYEPTIAQVEQAITSKTKAIIFSSPSNPTGLVLSKSYLQDLANMLEAYPHVLVISDEIYEYIDFTNDFTSIGSLENIKDRVITVNGFSKAYAMTGWRIGYLTAPLWLAKACEKIQGQLTSGPCSIAQRAALAAFSVDSSIIKEMRDTYYRRRDLALQHLQQLPHITCNIPTGAFYLFPDISYYFGFTNGEMVINNTEDFCMYMLKEANVTLVSGSAFGEPNCLRLSYAASEEIIIESIDRMGKTLLKLYKTF